MNQNSSADLFSIFPGAGKEDFVGGALFAGKSICFDMTLDVSFGVGFSVIIFSNAAGLPVFWVFWSDIRWFQFKIFRPDPRQSKWWSAFLKWNGVHFLYPTLLILLAEFDQYNHLTLKNRGAHYKTTEKEHCPETWTAKHIFKHWKYSIIISFILNLLVNLTALARLITFCVVIISLIKDFLNAIIRMYLKIKQNHPWNTKF